MSSAECLAMARKFVALKGAISGLHGPVNTCVAAIANSEADMADTVINCQPIDEGKISESKGEISSISGFLDAMMAECDEKYDYWMQEYYFALEREKQLRFQGYY